MLKQRRTDGVLHLELDRPELGNALDPALVEALIDAVGKAGQDAHLHSLVLQTSGRHFCTGLDLSGLDDLSDGDLLLRLVRIETLLSLVWHAPLRTVALARGRAWGAGADLFAACELRLVAPDTSLRFPGAQFGIVLGTRRLAERIGADAARRLVLEGGVLNAEQAVAAGLATQVADAVALDAPPVVAPAAAAIRAATRPDLRDGDLAALVRSAAEPGLQARIGAYRARLLADRPG